MLEFRVGDKAVYPTQGVAEVVGIETKEIGGKLLQFYSLRIIDADRRILVPVDLSDAMGDTVRAACAVADVLGATVLIAHVIDALWASYSGSRRAR